MKPSSVRFLNLLFSLLIFVGALLIYAFLLKPAYSDINKLRSDLLGKAELVKEQTKIVEQVKMLLEQYKSLTGPQQALLFSFPNDYEYPTVVNQISGLAKSAGLELKLLDINLVPFDKTSSTKAKVALPVVGAIRISMSLTGPYEGLKNFLNILESNVRIMDLVSLNFSPIGTIQTYNMIVNAYYQTL